MPGLQRCTQPDSRCLSVLHVVYVALVIAGTHQPFSHSSAPPAHCCPRVTMRHLLWLLFLPGVLCQCDPQILLPRSLIAWKGASLYIPCSYQWCRLNSPPSISLVWYLNPEYNKEKKEFAGTVLYKSNTPISPAFQGRVKLPEDLDRDCSLQLSGLQTNETGTYGARLIANVSGKPIKWISRTDVNVMDSPPAPEIQTNSEFREATWAEVTCSIAYYSPDYPINLNWEGLQRGTQASATRLVSEGRRMENTLSFTPTWKDHGKKLTCRLSTPAGTVSSEESLVLDVKYAPKEVQVKATPTETILEGQTLVLMCVTKSSNPTVFTYNWYKDGQWLHKDSAPKLTFVAQADEHFGSYYCTADNEIGRDRSAPLQIVVQYAPKDVRVELGLGSPIHEGATVVLSCSCTAVPPVSSYTWYRNSQLLPAQTQQELRFENIHHDQSGVYHCEPQNPVGKSKSPAFTVDVQYAPKGVEILLTNPRRILEGEEVILNCSVSSSKPPVTKYQWYWENSLYLETQRSTLTFPAREEQSGSYSCAAENAVSSGHSSPVSVDVQYKPKGVTVTREPSGSLCEGTTVTLQCSVARANPASLQYAWYKDEVLQGQSSELLRLTAVTSASSGLYHCEAQNAVGTTVAKAMPLDVCYGPRDVQMSVAPRGQIVEGMDLRLWCLADANPAVHRYDWYLNDQLQERQTQATMVLMDVQVEASGKYHCRASNQVSSGDSPPVHLTVYYSSKTIAKKSALGSSVVVLFFLLLGVLLFTLKQWKKRRLPTLVLDPVGRRSSFFPRRRAPLNTPQPASSMRCLNGISPEAINYATLQFPPSHPEGTDAPARGPRSSRQGVEPQGSGEAALYCVVKKPNLQPKGEAKGDYENVQTQPEEDELNYCTLVLPSPRTRGPPGRWESESSVQYAALRH
ncbi:LOW QUALITY PROTEIN: B-cell receptor CD22 [Carettochelys insculpta]|uniref:LOW QUALITY PROTEIN: B-cell receptor CD22 n=1 Tax=Carettochelys insculpta TaxID=44489 RepID=UPI003EBBA840